MAHEYTTWAYQLEIDQPLAKFVLVCLADVSDEHGRSFPGQKRISRMTGMGERTIRRHLEWLEAHGLVRREMRRRKDGTRTSDEYHLPPKGPTGHIGRWPSTGNAGRLSERARNADPDGDTTPATTGQRDRLSTGQIGRSNRPNTTGSPAKLAGHEPSVNHQRTEPPLLPHEPSANDAEAAAAERDREDKTDLEDLTPYQRRQATRPPDKFAASRLATYHPSAWNALIDFRRMHGEVRDAQFNAWARAVAEDVDAHGERIVAAALTVTVENFPTLKQPFSFYRACVRRAATDTPGRNGDLSAPAVMSQADLDRMFQLAKEGALA